MALKDFFTQFTTPKSLPPDQTDRQPPLKLPRRRKRKPELVKQLDRIPADNESARERLERLAKWKTRADRAAKVRQDWEAQYEVERCEKYFLGQQWDRGIRKADFVLNHFLATIKGIKPGLVFAHPKFYVRPKPGRQSPSGELRAMMGEGTLEAIGQQNQNLKRSSKLALLQAFFRIGALKAVYDPRLEPNPRRGELLYETDEEGVPIKDKTGAMQLKIDPLTGDPLVESESVMTDEAYRYVYVDSRHLLLPDEGCDPQRWTWIGEEVLVPLADAKRDERFPTNLREQLEANTSSTEGRAGAYAHLNSVKEDERFQYTEIYDHIGKRLLIWADGQPFEDFLVDDPLPPGIDDDPYALLILGEPITGPTPNPWPLPATHHWLESQRDYNQTRQQISEGGKRSARKIVYDDGTFPDADEAVKFLQDPSDMTAAKVTDVMRPPLILPSPDINASIYKGVNFILADWRILTGQTGARMGDPDTDTATEATFVERAANVRDADMQDLVSDWLSTAGQKMLQLVQQTLTFGLWIKYRGWSDKEVLTYAERYWGVPREQLMMLFQQAPQLKGILLARFGEDRWQHVTREQLTFEAEVTVAPGSMRPRNLDLERKNWFELLRIVGQFPQLALSRELLRHTAAKLEGIDERMIDEIVALAQKMVEIQQKVAGREQGGSMNGGGAGSSTAGNPDLAALVAGVQGGLG